MKSLFRCSIEADHSAVPICHAVGRRAQRRSRRAVGPRAMARLVLDRSEHAGMLARSKEVILALDSQHGIYRERVSAAALRSGEGRFIEPKADSQPWRRELVFMPHSRPSPRWPRTAQSGGGRSFAPIRPSRQKITRGAYSAE